jgi:putative ATP-dependent endonuclease of OLD family
MQITRVTIDNYRNLDGVEVVLDRNVSFLIGENELGKSNFLDLLDTIFNRRSFSEEDFLHLGEPIRVEFSLLLSELERGNFEDIFDPMRSERINVAAKQEYSEIGEWITFLWKEGEESSVEIPPALFRRVNFIRYDSLRAPREELTFRRGRGVSRFLSYLVQEFINQSESHTQQEYLQEDNISSLITYIDQVLKRIKPLRSQSIGIFTDAGNPVELLGRILKLKGADDFDIQRSGYGVQFSALVILSVLERLMSLKQSTRWADSVFTGKRSHFSGREYDYFLRRFPHAGEVLEPFIEREGDKVSIDVESIPDEQKDTLGDDALSGIVQEHSISLILGLDEPEIHLHPYRQRSLVKYIVNLLNNRDPEFSTLLKEIFGVDAINGQAIIVSHSPNVLPDNYKHIVRFYREGTTVRVVSGQSVQIDRQMEKHLLMNLPYIKEAFFSRCVIVVEGQTEAGALPIWTEKVIGDPDDFGIVVINARGIESVPPVVRLLNELRIPNVSVIDRDDYDDASHSSIDGLRVTAHRDFEEELFETVFARDSSVAILFEVLEEYGTRGLNRYARKNRLEMVAAKYGIDITWDAAIHTDCCRFSEILDSTDKNFLKVMFLSWLTLERVKTVSLGRFLGEKIGPDLIPGTYRELIRETKLKAEQADGGSDQEDSAVSHSRRGMG